MYSSSSLSVGNFEVTEVGRITPGFVWDDFNIRKKLDLWTNLLLFQIGVAIQWSANYYDYIWTQQKHYNDQMQNMSKKRWTYILHLLCPIGPASENRNSINWYPPHVVPQGQVIANGRLPKEQET